MLFISGMLGRILGDVAKDWLETLKLKHLRAAVLKAELSIIEAELRDARAILAGRIAVTPEPNKPKSRHGFTGGKRAKPIQEGSSVWYSEKILRDTGHPLSVDALLVKINAVSDTPVQKPTLVSNLSRYVKHGDTFNRPAPSTFGLVEWDTRGVEPNPEPYPDQDPTDMEGG